jgi:hypothetical protein
LFIERALMMSLATRDASVRRVNVADGHVIVGRFQRRLRFLQNALRFTGASFLEIEPAFEQTHDVRHRLKTHRLREVASALRVRERVVIAAFLAQRASDPKTGDRHGLLVGKIARDRKNKLKMMDRPIVIFVRQRHASLGQAQMRVAFQRQRRARCLRKTRDQSAQKPVIAVTDVDPLREQSQQRRGVRLRGPERFHQRLVTAQALESAIDAAEGEVFAQSGDQRWRDRSGVFLQSISS